MSSDTRFGLDRILRTIRQFFSSALTRSSGPRRRMGGVDPLLGSRQGPVAAGVRIHAASPLRHPD
jgi:hypothetical protein